MNRLPTLLSSSTFDVTLRNEALKTDKQVVAEPRLPIEFPHQLFFPSQFVPTYDYPLVVWLHSQRSSEGELAGVMDSLSDQNYLAVAPRANRRSKSRRRVFQWGESLADFAFAEDAVWECIEASLESLPVNRNRVFLAGFGMGGTLAQWIGLQNPERIAGVISLSGPIPDFNGSLKHWKAAKQLPILFSQRRGSSLCSETDLGKAIQFAYRSSLSYRFWQLHSEADTFDESDQLSSEMLAAANRFMMGIVTDSDISLRPEPNRDLMVGPFGLN